MTLNTEEQTLLEVVREARANKKTVPGKDESRGVTLEGAYKIAKAARGDRVLKGYKLGLISPAKQQQMGIDTPLYGPIYADTIYQNKIPFNNFIQPRVEPEIAVVLRDAIDSDATPGSVDRAIGGYFLGVDILDSVWDGYQFNLVEVVADSTSCGGFLPGQVMLEQMPSGTIQLFLNGELRTEGPVAALGSIVERLQWLAKTVGGLDAGMMIFFGSPAAATPAELGTLEVVDSNGNSLIAKFTG